MMQGSLQGKRAIQGIVWSGLLAFGGLAGMGQTAAPAATPAPAPEQQKAVDENMPKAPITVLEDTMIRVMTNAPVNSKQESQGMRLLFTVSEDVKVGDALAIPRGARVHGRVVKSKKAGVLTGSPELTLELESMDLGGKSYPLYSYPFHVKGTSKTGPTETKAVRGAEVGAVVGAIDSGVRVRAKGAVADDGSSRVASMATGAVLGAGVGTLVSAATPGPGIWIPSESQVDFYLAAPITVTPVSTKEAARLGQGLRPGGPTLYVRGDEQ